MNKISTYSDVVELNRILTSIELNPFKSIESDNKEVEAYYFLKRLLYDNSKIVISDGNTFKEFAKTNPFIEYMINQWTLGRIAIEICETGASSQTYFDPISLSITNDSLTKSHTLCLDHNGWKKTIGKVSLRKDYEIHFVERLNTFNGWDFIKEINIPTNACIITDRYFLKNEYNYHNNVFKIVDSILGNKLHSEYHLSILTDAKQLSNSNKTYKLISNHINKNHSNVTFGLFLPHKNTKHDRRIITNYFELYSGDSFDYYNNNGKLITETKLMYTPINNENINNYFLILRSLKHTMENSYVIGSKINRLVDCI